MRVQQLTGALTRLAHEHPDLPEPTIVSLYPRLLPGPRQPLEATIQVPTVADVGAWASALGVIPTVSELGRQIITRCEFTREDAMFRVYCVVVQPAEVPAHG